MSCRVDLVGRRFGEWTVLRRTSPRMTPGGQRAQRWLCRCSCGAKVAVRHAHLVSGASRRCLACRDARNNRIVRELWSRRIPGGKTIAQIALDAGVKLDTVYHRWIRGWPIERLGAPARRYRRVA